MHGWVQPNASSHSDPSKRVLHVTRSSTIYEGQHYIFIKDLVMHSEVISTFQWVMIHSSEPLQPWEWHFHVQKKILSRLRIVAATARILVSECCATSSPFLQGQPHKAFTVLQGDGIHAWSTLQRLRCSSNDDDHSISCTVTRQQVVDGVLVHWTDSWEGK